MLTRHNDDDSNGVQVGENVVGNTTKVHGSAHLSQVGIHLAVSEPKDGNPEKDGAGSETTSNLINPGIVKVVPGWLVGAKSGRLYGVPHMARVPVLVGGDWVGTHSVSESLEKELEGRAHDVAARRTENVELLAEDENRDSDDEHDGGDQVCQPEANISFRVHHTDLANKGTDVDKEVEPV